MTIPSGNLSMIARKAETWVGNSVSVIIAQANPVFEGEPLIARLRHKPCVVFVPVMQPLGPFAPARGCNALFSRHARSLQVEGFCPSTS